MVVVCGGADAAAAGCVGAGAVGPLSSEDDDEEEDGEEEDGRRLCGAGARSASGSSRLTILAMGGVGGGRVAVALYGPVDEEDRDSPGPSGGGGSSICICCAVRSSAGVGSSP